MADIYTRLAASAPINADAAKAFSMHGEHEPEVRLSEGHAHWEAPPKTKPVPFGQTDYTGRKWGKLTVVGYLYDHPKHKGSRWLVRCVCGRYEVRAGKTIRAANNDHHAECARCNANRRRRERPRFNASVPHPSKERVKA